MTRLQANALLLLAAIIWGSSFVAQQVGVGELGSISFTGARFLVGGLLVLPLGIWQYRKLRRQGKSIARRDRWAIAATGLVLLTAAILQQHGILNTTVTNSGFLTALYVPLVPMLGLIVLRRRVHFSIWPASLTCFLGTYILSGAGKVELAMGDFWVIGSTLFWATHVILVGALASRTGAPLVLAAGQFLVCGTVGLGLGQVIEGATFPQFSSAVWGILYVGVFSVGMAFTMQVVAQRYTPAPDAAIILSSETVFAALGGMLFLGERLSLLQLSGAALILAAILAVELLPLLARARPLR